LDETYDRILLQIDTNYHPIAVLALEVLCFSKRPLKIHELAEVVALKPNTQPLEFPDRLFDPDDIRLILSSLVSLGENGIVRLAHYSVQEYLLSDRIRTGPVSQFGFDEGLAHLHVAERCLTYLLSFAKADSLNPNICHEYPLLDYSASYWHLHTDRALENDGRRNRSLREMVLEFCDTDSHLAFVNALRIADPEDLADSDLWARPGLFSDFRQECSREDFFELGDPIYHASAAGCSHIVQLLLDDATALMECGLYGSALKTAISEGHIDIVRKLLKECDVDIHGKEDDIFTPLWLAVQVESRELVHILLDAGANVNITTDHEDEGTPLHLAASSNYTGLADSIYFAELFLCHGAVTHLLDNRELILIQTAAKSILSPEEYAETLLDVIVAGERKGVEWGTTLISVNGNLSREDCEIHLVTAVVRGDESEVKNLLNLGASTTTLELLRTLVRVAENRAQEALPDGEEHKRKFQSIAVLLQLQVHKLETLQAGSESSREEQQEKSNEAEDEDSTRELPVEN
jgi:hypothetical protein